MWTDDPDIEAAEYDESEADGFGESDGESDLDSEESRAERRRRARARAQRVALARRRQAATRARAVAKRQPSAVSTPSTQRATASAARTLDLETKVQEDTFRNAIKAQNKRISRGEYAAVAGAAVNQFIETFEAPDNKIARAALRFSPLLLLAPQSKGRGVDALIKDPRVIGAAAVAGLVLAGEFRTNKNKVHKIDILGPDTIPKTGTTTFVADVLDGNNKSIPKEKAPVTWASTDPNVATIDANGVVTPVAAGAGKGCGHHRDVRRRRGQEVHHGQSLTAAANRRQPDNPPHTDVVEARRSRMDINHDAILPLMVAPATAYRRTAAPPGRRVVGVDRGTLRHHRPPRPRADRTNTAWRCVADRHTGPTWRRRMRCGHPCEPQPAGIVPRRTTRVVLHGQRSDRRSPPPHP